MPARISRSTGAKKFRGGLFSINISSLWDEDRATYGHYLLRQVFRDSTLTKYLADFWSPAIDKVSCIHAA
jgi:hypothetical protein